MNNTEKSAYQEKMEAKLKKLKADIEYLEGELLEKKSDGRAGAQEQLQRLRQQREAVKSRLHELKSASGAAWEQAKTGIAQAWNDLEAAYHNARAELKKNG